MLYEDVKFSPITNEEPETGEGEGEEGGEGESVE